jgi:predicted dehydrogenase/threonine dehydrogenase-like Zn-dependent dehydrogenase
VACAGAGSANHAEVVSVPANLVVPVAEEVPARAAAFATLGAIALQGVRRADLSLGEHVVVVGLGLLGLITVQLLRAAGCPVLGVEPLEARRKLGLSLGAEVVAGPDEARQAVSDWTGGQGADAVVVTASSTASVIVNSAVEMTRRKGRVVPVGDVGLEIERGPLYHRETDLLISTSYGPGRYDATYEEGGIDYPIGYVRWTENRNMQEIVRLLAVGALRVEPLIDIEVPLERVDAAYAALAGPESPLAAVILYDSDAARARLARGPVVVPVGTAAGHRKPSGETVGIALVGAGGFVKAVHIPNIKAAPGAEVRIVVNSSGTSASDVGRLLGGADTATDWRAAVERADVDLVLIGTRHDTHAEIAAAALRAGKAVFVEKPLGLSRAEIDAVWDAGLENPRLAIGFNREWAPLARAMRDELDRHQGPIHLIYRVCAPLPVEHWLNDPATGGGRVQGEACHMFDFANWLCGRPERVWGAALPTTQPARSPESVSVSIQYSNGSLATVHYSGAGSGGMPKERIEVLAAGRSWVLDDFTSLTSYADGGTQVRTNRADKGHAELMTHVLRACRDATPFQPGLAAAYAAQSVALAALESIATGNAIPVRFR